MRAEPSMVQPPPRVVQLMEGLNHQARVDGGKELPQHIFPRCILTLQVILQEAWKMYLLISTACPLGLLHPLNSLKVHYCPRCLQTRGKRNRPLYLCWLFLLFSNYHTNLLTFHFVLLERAVALKFLMSVSSRSGLLAWSYLESFTTGEILAVVSY